MNRGLRDAIPRKVQARWNLAGGNRKLPAMFDNLAVSGVAHVIELAVAPVFLLSGIGAMLAVMTQRLARVVDRARVLESKLPNAEPAAYTAMYAALKTLARRARVIGWAIALCTLTALLVCAVIITLFLGAFLSFNAGLTVATLFIAALLSFVCALLFFLREVFLATYSLKIGPG